MTIALLARFLAFAALAVLIPGILIHARLFRAMSTRCRISFISLALLLSLLCSSMLVLSFC